jgi:hypothetical protein
LYIISIIVLFFHPELSLKEVAAAEVSPMADGGFVIKFDGHEVACYKVSFSYDEWTYTKNFEAPKPLPDTVKTISVVTEGESR